eukprot:5987983-Prymnesium_polylepis.1
MGAPFQHRALLRWGAASEEHMLAVGQVTVQLRPAGALVADVRKLTECRSRRLSDVELSLIHI